MSRSVIVSAVRTPFGKLGGSLADKPATELGSIVIRAALERAELEPDEVEYVIMGQVLQAGAGQAPARQAAIGAGIPIEVGADTINKVCASSIRAVEIADQMIRAGDHELVVPGGEFAVDEGPRRDTSLEKLAALKPVFDPEGTTTAGNAPGVNDGAGCVVVTSEEYARKRGLPILATIVAKAGRLALEKAGKTIDDVERVELNEAFSSVVLNLTKMLGADPEQVNVNGGAVALGHPIGASGARILGTMVHELRRNGGGLGLAAICSGGGQGDALLVEV